MTTPVSFSGNASKAASERVLATITNNQALKDQLRSGMNPNPRSQRLPENCAQLLTGAAAQLNNQHPTVIQQTNPTGSAPQMYGITSQQGQGMVLAPPQAQGPPSTPAPPSAPTPPLVSLEHLPPAPETQGDADYEPMPKLQRMDDPQPTAQGLLENLMEGTFGSKEAPTIASPQKGDHPEPAGTSIPAARVYSDNSTSMTFEAKSVATSMEISATDSATSMEILAKDSATSMEISAKNSATSTETTEVKDEATSLTPEDLSQEKPKIVLGGFGVDFATRKGCFYPEESKEGGEAVFILKCRIPAQGAKRKLIPYEFVSGIKLPAGQEKEKFEGATPGFDFQYSGNIEDRFGCFQADCKLFK